MSDLLPRCSHAGLRAGAVSGSHFRAGTLPSNAIGTAGGWAVRLATLAAGQRWFYDLADAATSSLKSVNVGFESTNTLSLYCSGGTGATVPIGLTPAVGEPFFWFASNAGAGANNARAGVARPRDRAFTAVTTAGDAFTPATLELGNDSYDEFSENMAFLSWFYFPGLVLTDPELWAIKEQPTLPRFTVPPLVDMLAGAGPIELNRVNRAIAAPLVVTGTAPVLTRVNWGRSLPRRRPSVTPAPSGGTTLNLSSVMRMGAGRALGQLATAAALQSQLRAQPARATGQVAQATALSSTQRATPARLTGGAFGVTLPLASVLRATPARMPGSVLASTAALQGRLVVPSVRFFADLTLGVYAAECLATPARLLGQLSFVLDLRSTLRGYGPRMLGNLSVTSPGTLALASTLRGSPARIRGLGPASDVALASFVRTTPERLLGASLASAISLASLVRSPSVRCTGSLAQGLALRSALVRATPARLVGWPLSDLLDPVPEGAVAVRFLAVRMPSVLAVVVHPGAPDES